MVFTGAAAADSATSAAASEAVMHDWWAYLIVSGAGGRVLYDPEPMVRYRQHGRNQIGAAVGALRRTANAADMLGGRMRRWNDQNLRALATVRPLLTPENTRTLDAFEAARQGSMGSRVAALRRSGVYRQTRRGSALVAVATLLNRL
jgi:hypothetical protein